MADDIEWTRADAARWITVPAPTDDKYAHGVLGVVTGSTEYPGAAVLGVDAAVHTGVGMVRYLGPVPDAVLARRPEAVTQPGRVQAWLLGSGQSAEAARSEFSRAALASGEPLVLDAGAITLADAGAMAGPAVITPHAGELAELVGVSRDEVEADPSSAASSAASRFSVTVLLKGHRSVVVSPAGRVLTVTAPTTWLATAGSGDSLAGILGALVATHPRAADSLMELAATACVVHGEAAGSFGGPFPVLGLNEAIPAVIARLTAR